MKYDIVIKGGTIATDAETFQADIGIRDGRIEKIGTLGASAAELIDATGRYVLPGGIDSHVHIAQPSGEGIVMADDFESGTRSALFGGNTTILPFCLQQRGQSIRQAIKWYHGLADGNCYTDVSFHLIISDPTAQVSGISLTMLRAAWRMVAMLAGPLPVLSRMRSSWKTTSITQWSRFSMPQWARTAAAKARAESGADER
jgi:dihydropyrimidinase